MNKLTQEQLNKVVFADLSDFDSATNTFNIKRYSKPVFELNNCYLVKISVNVVNNPNNLISINWNNGTAPSKEYYKVYVSKTMGKMLYLDCREYDFENKIDLSGMYSGWFSVDDLTQLAKI